MSNQTVTYDDHVLQYALRVNQIIINFETLGFNDGSSFAIEIMKCIQKNNIPLKSFSIHKFQITERRECS